MHGQDPENRIKASIAEWQRLGKALDHRVQRLLQCERLNELIDKGGYAVDEVCTEGYISLDLVADSGTRCLRSHPSGRGCARRLR